MSKSKTIRNSCFLLLASFVWGISFVSQSTGGDLLGAYTFNGVRSFIGSAFLFGLCGVFSAMRKKDASENTKDESSNQSRSQTQREDAAKQEWKQLLKAGCICGLILFVATSLQQVGITMGTSSGKAGFLTACYIVLVPIFSIFLGKKCGWNVWVAVVLAVCGLYLLCIKGSFSMERCDILVLLCAICFACHILVIDHYSPLVDGVKLSCLQFFVCGVLSIVPMVMFEMKDMHAWLQGFTTAGAWISLLYAGIMSCGVGYTLQIVGQEGINPTVASILMSPESVFSVLAGFVLLHEILTGREILGCVIMFVAIILSQIPVKSRIKSGVHSMTSTNG